MSADDVEAVPMFKHRASDLRANHYGMGGKEFRLLLRLGAPAILFNIIRYLFLAVGLTNMKDLDAIQDWLTDIGITCTVGTVNFNWKQMIGLVKDQMEDGVFWKDEDTDGSRFASATPTA